MNQKLDASMNKTLLILITFLLSVTVLTACNSNPSKDADTLRSKAKAYGKLIRWKAYDDASAYIKLRDGSSVVVNSELLNEIRVTKYEVASMVLNEQQDEATITAEISYYHERVNNLHDIRDKQIWYKDKDSGDWYLDGNLPPFMR